MWITIICAIFVFLLILWLLVSVLLLVRKKMVPEGKVKIVINEEKSIEHERGCSLLQALSDEKVFVPSACGGGGTCGTCKASMSAACRLTEAMAQVFPDDPLKGDFALFGYGVDIERG